MSTQTLTETSTETVQLIAVSSRRVTIQQAGRSVTVRKFFFEEK